MAARRGCPQSRNCNDLGCPTGQNRPIEIPRENRISSNLRDHIPDRIKRTTKCIGFALWLNEPDAWLDVMAVMGLRLSPGERAGLALAVLESLPVDIAAEVAESSILDRVVRP